MIPYFRKFVETLRYVCLSWWKCWNEYHLTLDQFDNNMGQLKVVECNYFIPFDRETEFKVRFSSNYTKQRVMSGYQNLLIRHFIFTVLAISLSSFNLLKQE